MAEEKLVFEPGVVIATAVEKGDAAGNDYEFILTINEAFPASHRASLIAASYSNAI